MASEVEHPQGDTLVLTIPVTGIPAGRTIDSARIVIGGGTLFDKSTTDAEVTVVDTSVIVTADAATTEMWATGGYDVEVKVKLDDGQIGRVVDSRIVVLPSTIGDTVP